LSTSLLLILLSGFLLLLFPLIVEQSTTIAAAVPGYYQNLREWMVNYPNQLIMRLSEFLPATLPSLMPVEPSDLFHPSQPFTGEEGSPTSTKP
jgi:predicted PurR-regulated permease PerM